MPQEFVPVMVVEMAIFSLAAVGIQLAVSGSFAVPVVIALGLCVLITVTVAYVLGLLVHGRDVLVPDPGIDVLSGAAQFLTRNDKVDLTLRTSHVMLVASALFELQVAYLLVLLSHVVAVALATGEDVDAEADYWLLLFRFSWESESPSRYMIILNVVVHLAILLLLLVVSYIVYVSFVKPGLAEYAVGSSPIQPAEYTPSVFWLYAVAISQILQYTIWLYSQNLENVHLSLTWAFVPWVLDFVCNQIGAQGFLDYFYDRDGNRVNAVSSVDYLCLYSSRLLTPVLMLWWTCFRSFVFVHENFWALNIVFIVSLAITRYLESANDIRVYQSQGLGISEVARTQPRPAIYKTMLGVQQPRLFFKKRGFSKRE